MAEPGSTIAGKAALVTGGGSGIGLGTAGLLAAEGCHITICGRTEDKLLAAANEIRQRATGSATVTTIVADVTDEDAVANAVAKATEATGHLDILFACAGGAHHMGPLIEADAASVRATVDLNLVGSFLCVKHAAADMVAKGTAGSIVLMSSGAGVFPHKLLWAYGMAKAGIVFFTKTAAEELGTYGIRVNAVAPGIVDDELMSMITAGGPLLDDYLDQMPLGRVGTVDDVAQAVRYLAGPESSWVTGECLSIDGGHHLRRGADYSKLFGS